MSNTNLHVEIVYALPDTQTLLPLDVPQGTTIEQALDASGLLVTHPELASPEVPAGIWGKRRSRDTVLQEGDRIEFYRPLEADPKAVRRARAQQRQENER